MKSYVKLLALFLVLVTFTTQVVSCAFPWMNNEKSVGDTNTMENVVITPPNNNEGNNNGGNSGENTEPVTPPKADDVHLSASVTPDAENKVPEGGVNMNGDSASATVPGGVQLEEGATELALTINGITESTAKIELAETEVSTSLDVHIAGVAASNLVPMEVKLLAAALKGLNSTSIRLYHVENGTTIEMIRVANNETFTSHNQFKYDPITGDITLYIASFSEIAIVNDTNNAWEGEFDYSWYDASKTNFVIANADQLAAFGAIVGGMNGYEKDSFEGKIVTLSADINLGDKESENNPDIIFYPIGYYNNEGTYEKSNEVITSNVSAFKGTFDGNGHTIKNFYQNTWEMKGDNPYYEASLQYYNDAMGLFGYVYGGTIKNLTVDNFSSDGEYTPTGVIAAYAVASTFENIAITNCNPRVYNTGNGGIIGIAGRTNDAVESITLKNITVDNTNKISALWGSYDVACGGLVGMYRGNADGNGNSTGDTIYFENCHVSAQMDVYNDVCANYQYYAYRYAGMFIGSVRHNTTNDEGKTIPNMVGISAKDCTVHFGTWNDYYYCEFERNTMASYSEDYQFSRVPHSEINFTDSNGNGIIDTVEEKASVTGCKHNHTEAENKQAVCLPFTNLFTGYGWGVSSMAIDKWNGITKLDIEVGDHETSVEKFEGKVDELVSGKDYTLGDIFNFVDNGVELVPDALTVTITNLDENGNVVATIVYNANDWANSTITFTGAGAIQITIQDYYFCTPTTINVQIKNHEHVYSNNCDATCNECGEAREVGEHVYDNNCDTTCNECSAERTIEHVEGETVIENTVASSCTENGSYDKVVYCTVCGEEISRETVTVDALGHTPGAEATCTTAQICTVCNAVINGALGHTEVIDAAVEATCKATGLTEGKHCSVCNEVILAQTVVEKLAHTEVIDAAVSATCTETGLTEGKHCSVCNEVIVAQTVVEKLAHTEVVDAAVEATCTATGLTAGKHCSVCNTVLVAQETIEKLGHTPGAEATCTTAQICTVCSKELVGAYGHNYKAVVTAPTCENGGYTTHTCANCGDTYTDNEVDALGHIEKLFSSNDFTYRVGNQNAVGLSSLFNIGNHNVTVGATNVSGNASVTINGTSLKFNDTGVVKVTLTSDCTCDECALELTLEVVDAFNVTSATSATNKNVVLLNDCGFSSLEVSGGYTLFGNGFTMTCGSDSPALDMGYAFVTLNNGTLDNVQIVCPNFDYAVLYKSNMTESGNRSQTTDKTRYYNVKSGVMVSGNSQILNSRISGARAAVNVTGGNCLIDNSRLEGGAVASLLVGAANSVTLRDVTLVQEPTASTYDSSKKLMGFSVLFICDSNGNAAPITIEGTLVQDAWVNETDKQYVPSAGQSIISTVLGKTDYLHDIDGDGKNESLNLGFAYMPESLTSKVNATTITDNRTNQSSIPYNYVEVSILNGKTYVYSYKNSNGTDDAFKKAGEYTPNKYGDIITVSYDDTRDGLESGKSYGTDGWVYELNVDLDKASGYKLDFSKLSMVVNGVSVTDYKVNGSAKPTSPVAVTAGGVTYTLTATIDGKEYTATFKVTGTETSKESPSIVSANYQAGLCVASSYGGTWHGAAPALEGIVIKYWSVAESRYIELNLGDITISKGQLNGTNTTWTYTPTNGDYTLTLTGGQVHSSNNVYAMPVGVDGTLYFVAAKSSGLVNSGNSARTIPVSYTFKDNNGGEVLTFSHTWSVAENKDEQYNYSDFCKGTLTKLESSGGGTCLAAGTMITLADGSKKAVEDLRKGDLVMSFDHLTGEIVYKDVIIVVKTHSNLYYKNTFVFDDGTELVTINEHGIYDLDLNKYVNIDHENYADYIGHRFVSVDTNGNINVKTLIDVTTVCESGYKYDIVTNGTLNYVAENTLSVTHVLVDVINSFDFDENMIYDQEKMVADIEQYGLYDFSEWVEYCDYSVFEQYNIPVMKVGISKGLYTKEYIIGLINTYVLDDSVQIID